MTRGTVVEDIHGKLWLCIRTGDHPVSADLNALMKCEDNRIDRPIRWFKNVPVERIIAIPNEDT